MDIDFPNSKYDAHLNHDCDYLLAGSGVALELRCLRSLFLFIEIVEDIAVIRKSSKPYPKY